jgi:hypothetical protein
LLTRRFSLPVACVIWLVVRLAYNSLRQLVPDEAYYWVWSRHLSGGYLDHPPMVAWLIRAGTACFGDNEFAVRIGAAILMFVSILVLIGLTRRLGGDERQQNWTAAILLLAPMAAVLGMIVAPDTPACLFSLCALAAACRMTAGGWIAFGLFFGLAMTSKYTAVLVGAAVGIAVLSTPAGRKQLLGPWPWIGLIVAALVFWPVVRWNHDHAWASFRFQWHHGTGTAEPATPVANGLSYVAGQAAVYTPVLFVLGMMALAWRWRQFASLDTAQRMIVLAATVPLVFFGLFSLRHRPEANWPVFAYWPLTIVLVQWLADGWRPGRLHWARVGVVVAAAATVVGHVPEVIELIPVERMPTIPSRWEDMFGWRDMAAELDEVGGGAGIYCTSYENAAEAEFYMAGHPQVWTVDSDRPTEFDFLPGRPDPPSLNQVVYVTRFSPETGVPADLRDFSSVAMQPWATEALGRLVRRRWIIVAKK